MCDLHMHDMYVYGVLCIRMIAGWQEYATAALARAASAATEAVIEADAAASAAEAAVSAADVAAASSEATPVEALGSDFLPPT